MTRQRIVDELIRKGNDLEKEEEQAASSAKFGFEQEERFGLPAAMLKRMASAVEREKPHRWLSLDQGRPDPRGRNRFWKHFQCKDSGCRLSKDGSKKKTFSSPFSAEESQLESWAQQEEAVSGGLSKIAV